MTKVNPNNGNQTKSDIFPWDHGHDRTYSNLVSLFVGPKILKHFSDFYN